MKFYALEFPERVLLKKISWFLSRRNFFLSVSFTRLQLLCQDYNTVNNGENCTLQYNQIFAF